MTDDAFAMRIEAYRPYLLRVAVLQLRDNHLAEDVVQETIVAALARVFMMREAIELESAEICKELSITSTNLCVILHPARVALRQCLEEHWFAKSGRAA